MSDESRFRELQDALKLMRIEGKTQKTVFKVIAGILHLGNVAFVENDKSYSDITKKSEPYVKKAAELFSIPYNGLYKRLTSRTVRVVRTRVMEFSFVSHLPSDVFPAAKTSRFCFKASAWRNAN